MRDLLISQDSIRFYDDHRYYSYSPETGAAAKICLDTFLELGSACNTDAKRLRSGSLPMHRNPTLMERGTTRVEVDEILKRPPLKHVDKSECRTDQCKVSIHATNSCNLDCKYCFTRLRAETRNNRRITEKMFDDAIDVLISQSDSCHANLGIVGGEPLLDVDFLKTMITHFCKRMQRAKNVRGHGIGISTNGTLIEGKLADFLAAHKVKLTVSMDGPAAIQNMQRPERKGGRSYSATMKGYRVAQKVYHDHGSSVAAYAMLMPGEVEPREIVEHALANEVDQMVIMPVRPFHGEDREEQDEHSIRFQKQYTALADYLLQRASDGNFDALKVLWNKYDFFMRYVIRILTGKRQVYRCRAGLGDFSVSEDGRIYPCAVFAGSRDGSLGPVSNESLSLLNARFEKRLVDSSVTCRRCWCRYLCGGPCAWLSWVAFRDIDIPLNSICELQKHMVYISIAFIFEMEHIAPGLLWNWIECDPGVAEGKAGFPAEREIRLRRNYPI